MLETLLVSRRLGLPPLEIMTETLLFGRRYSLPPLHMKGLGIVMPMGGGVNS